MTVLGVNDTLGSGARLEDQTPLLVVNGITMRFGGVTAINDVSFDVRRNELFAIIGPNASMRCIRHRKARSSSMAST
jgi:branched-chain amino acid transport system ATP-binding protein